MKDNSEQTNWIDHSKTKLRALLRLKMSPHQFAMSLAVGVAMGIFPILGLSTPLCFIVAFLCRLNLVLTQVINYAVYPLQLTMAPVFLYAGSWLMGEPLSIEGAREIIGLFADNIWVGLKTLGGLVLHTMLVWTLISPVLVLTIYFLTRYAKDNMKFQSERNKVSP